RAARPAPRPGSAAASTASAARGGPGGSSLAPRWTGPGRERPAAGGRAVKPIATVAAVQAADKAAQEGGTPVEVLMRRAGAAVARAAAAELGEVAGRRVVALAGKGHNGGDACEALARLARRGVGAGALGTGDPEALDEQGRRCVALVRWAGGRVRRFAPELADRLLGGAELVLDGLLGTGSSGAPRGVVAEAIAATTGAAAPGGGVGIPPGGG